MQVVNSTAFAESAYGAKKPPQQKRSVGAAAAYVANSSKLSAAEKNSFIRQLSSVGGGDMKIIATIMASVQLTESTREEGSYPINNVKTTGEKDRKPLPFDQPKFEDDKPRCDSECGVDILA
jgi:hypothetical protein